MAAKVASDDRSPGVLASANRPVVPILIRNEHGPVLRICVEIGKVEDTDVFARNDVSLDSISIALDGTDDLSDIASLRLFSTGGKEQFASDQPVGQAVPPAAVLTFPGESTALSAGKNYLWLSVRLNDTADLAHRIAASCTALATSAGTLHLADTSPGPRQRIGFALRQHNDDHVDTYRIPALTATAAGTLLCVYDVRRRAPGHDLQDDIDVGLSRSADGGRTWESPRVIVDMGEFGGLPQNQNGCGDPGIIVDRETGDIFCFALWMHGKPGHHQWVGKGSEPGFEIGHSAQFLMVRSRDDGRTWSKPENLTHQLKRAEWQLLAPSPQAGICLADGTLVMPIQGRDEHDAEFSTVMTSRDHGASWTVGIPIAAAKSSECQAAELGDGSIMLNMRSELPASSHRRVFLTFDHGQTWRAHESDDRTLIEPRCNGSLLRFDYAGAGQQKHVLLFANPHTQKGRTHQTLQVSFDDGRTWPEKYHILLDEQPGAGYPSLARIDDHHVGIVYEGSQSHLVFQTLALNELIEGQAFLP